MAAELGCSLRQATDYVREIQGCLTTILTTPSQRNRNMNNNGVDLERSSEGNNNNNNNNNKNSQVSIIYFVERMYPARRKISCGETATK